MATKSVSAEKNFRAVAFMRKQRDRITKDIANMSFEEIKKYFSKKKATKRKGADKGLSI